MRSRRRWPRRWKFFKRKNASVNKVVDVAKKQKWSGPKKNVVVMRRWYAPAHVTAFHLDNDEQERFHVTVIDPKKLL